MTTESSSPAVQDSGLKVGLLLIPVVLSTLLLAAHFLRDAALLLVLASLSLPFLLLFRRAWAVRVVQLAFTLGAVSWVWTAFNFLQQRKLMGMPYARMLVILGVVALFTLASALVLETPPLRRSFRR